jgi:hypothetical protein
MPGLTENAIPIPILRMDQKSPDTNGPVGRLARLVNGVVDKWETDNGSWLRVRKRDAFRVMPRTIGDPYNGGHVGTAGVPSPSVIDELAGQMFAVGSDAFPYVYSKASLAWQKFSEETIITNRVSLTSIWSKSTQIQCPDSSTAGSTHCYVWQQAGQSWLLLLDDEGTVLHAATQISSDGGRIKTVSNGTVHLIFSDNGGTTVSVFGLDQTGAALAGVTATTLFTAGDTWDIVYQADVGVALARRGSVASAPDGITIVSIGVVSGSITVSANDNVAGEWNSGPQTKDVGGGFLLNKTGDGFLYLCTITFQDSFSPYVSKIDLTATISHTYQPIVSDVAGQGITNVAGYVDAASTVYLMMAHLPYTGSAQGSGFALNAFIEMGSATTSADAQNYQIVRSVGLASRVFFVNGIPVAYVYYASVPSLAELGRVQSGQPTFFLLRADTGAVVGRVLHAIAAEDWTWSAWNGTDCPAPNSFQLPTPRVAADGSILVSLGQTGAQQVSRSVDSGGIVTIDNFISSVGVVDVGLGKPGTCVELDHETLIPGPLPRSFDGIEFSAAGIELSPEQPIISDSGPGHFNANEPRSYVIVYERQDRAGRKVHSGSSISVPYVIGGSAFNRSATLTIPTLRATTHDDVIIGVYRTPVVCGLGRGHHPPQGQQRPGPPHERSNRGHRDLRRCIERRGRDRRRNPVRRVRGRAFVRRRRRRPRGRPRPGPRFFVGMRVSKPGLHRPGQQCDRLLTAG